MSKLVRNGVQMKDLTSDKMKMVAERIYSEWSKFIYRIYLINDSEE